MKNIVLPVMLLLTLFGQSGCDRKTDGKEVVFVSIEPQRYFLEKIVGDKFTVRSLIPAGSNPETFDPTPSKMMMLGKSKLYFKTGLLDFENTSLKNIQANNTGLEILDTSASIAPIGANHSHESNHAHGPDCSHGHDGPDPHIWSSPGTARIMAENMYNAIIARDSLNRSYYEANFKELTATFNQTDSIIRDYLATAPSRSFIIYHPALSYFSEEYGLVQHSIESSGKQPTPSELAKLVDLARTENIKVVFMQTEYDQKNAETVAKEIGAKVVPINLMSYDWDAEMVKVAKALSGRNE